jgi:2-polyprenyl-3-methyl-5-hydroxy-6-metoxy-1,4-benzoquinol methylase
VKASTRCWCGNVELSMFSPGYLKCTACETLISACAQNSNPGKVINDEQDFYGRNYWFSHQEKDLGLDNIIARARTDLSERCLHWLRTVLKYKLPPGSILELGSGHGGFVAMLRQSGFDATGLEISPWVVDFARKTFGVPMLLGAVEDQKLKSGSLDGITLMDVLEHLPDPIGSMRRCLKLLKSDGIVVVQTPRYPEHKSHDEMVYGRDRFLEMLQEKEHLYLFSERSIRELFHRLGAEYLNFEPAIFAHYDMFLVISRVPLTANSQEVIEKVLSGTPNGRVMQALIDADERFQKLGSLLRESELDREARLGQINELSRCLKESESDREARLGQINELSRRLKESESDREARLGKINELTQRLKESESDQVLRLESINQLSHNLEQAQIKLNAAISELSLIEHNWFYRVFRKIGLFSKLEYSKGQFSLQENESLGGQQGKTNIMGDRSDHAADRPRKKLRRVAVDLTPVLPGGENGGAKLMTIELIRSLGRLSPDCEFILLTSDQNNAGLAVLDAPNVRRIVASGEKSKYIRNKSYLYPWLAILPVPLKQKLKYLYSHIIRKTKRGSILRDLDVGLLFCPFTAPFFYDPAVPVVSVIYDLQYRQYPQFFAPEDRFHRDRNFKEACRLANRLICISNYVRRTVIETAEVPPERVHTVYVRLPRRIAPVSSQIMDSILQILVISSQLLGT